MELLKGETVADAVANGRQSDGASARATLLQLGSALAEAHAAGVVHRDLKPENLFLATTKHADVPFVLKVLDFGIAKLLSEGASSVTATIGTPMCMAPEQTELGAAITPATDVWAYGLIAFYVLTTQSYWHLRIDGREVSGAALLRQIVLDALPSASQRAAQLGSVANLPSRIRYVVCALRLPPTRYAIHRRWRSLPGACQAVRRLRGRALSDHSDQPRHGVDPANASTECRPHAAAHAGTGTASHLVGLVIVSAGYVLARERKGTPDPAPSAEAGEFAQGSSPRSSAPSVASVSKATPIQPRDGMLFSSTPIELKWQSDGTAPAHDLEVARADSAAGLGHAPPGVAYAMWPWPGAPARPGAYRWRVSYREPGR